MRIALRHTACRLYNRYTVYIAIHRYTLLYIVYIVYSIHPVYISIHRIQYTSLYTPPLGVPSQHHQLRPPEAQPMVRRHPAELTHHNCHPYG